MFAIGVFEVPRTIVAAKLAFGDTGDTAEGMKNQTNEGQRECGAKENRSRGVTVAWDGECSMHEPGVHT